MKQRRRWVWVLWFAVALWLSVAIYGGSIDPVTAIETWEALPQEPVRFDLLQEVRSLRRDGRYRQAAFRLGEVLGLSRESLQAIVSDRQLHRLNDLETVPVTEERIRWLQQFGEVLTELGAVRAAEPVLHTALTLSQQLNSQQLENPSIADIFVSLGNLHRTIAQRYRGYGRSTVPAHDTAARFYRQALEISTSETVRRRTQLNLLSLAAETHSRDDLRPLQRSISQSLAAQPPSRDSITEQLNFAHSLTCLKLAAEDSPRPLSYVAPVVRHCRPPSPTIDPVSFTDLAEIISHAANQARSLGDRWGEAYALGQLGELYEIAGRFEDARRLTREALALSYAINAPSVSYRWQWQLGRLSYRGGDRTAALEAYRGSIETLQALRRDLAALNPDVQYDFRDEVEPVYREWVGLLLSEPSPTPEELTQARDAIEALQLAELDNFFGDACIEAAERPLQDLDPNINAVYTIVLPDGLHAIVSVPHQPLRHYRSPLPDPNLETFANITYQALAQNFNWQPVLEQAYDFLFRPLEEDLNARDGTTVAFVLDGPLRNIPVAALYDGDRYLIERYAIAIAPSWKLPPWASREFPQSKLLAAGRASFSQTDWKQFPQLDRTTWSDLPYVGDELEAIESLVSSETLFDEEFLSHRLASALNSHRFSAVHIATHAQFDAFAENTFVLAWDRPLTLDRLAQMLQGNGARPRTPLELLVLSACQTAEGSDRTVLGLAGMGIRAGARSTLGSLWHVNDRSTARLMAQFYRSLRHLSQQNRPNKAEALRQAQLNLLHSEGFSSPHFWAPFVLVGHWR
ncbi:CHAT domain-containing protein [Baaleninema sp.]|uniref:CHAT domain-containing protein n=1 Tax=Baaleninema sp. TaxID=3101197 RepID=UPI003D08214D